MCRYMVHLLYTYIISRGINLCSGNNSLGIGMCYFIQFFFSSYDKLCVCIKYILGIMYLRLLVLCFIFIFVYSGGNVPMDTYIHKSALYKHLFHPKLLCI